MKRTTKYIFALEVQENMPLRQDISLKLWRFNAGQRKVELCAQDTVRAFRDTSARMVLGHYESDYGLAAAEVGLILPRSSCVVRFLELPKTSRREMRSMIQLQLGHMLPYDASDITFDFVVFEREGKAQVRVAVFIVTKEVMEQHLSFFEPLGHPPAFIYPATMLLMAAYRDCCFSTGQGTVVIDVDHTAAEIVAADASGLVMTQNFSYAGDREHEFIDRAVFSLKKAHAAGNLSGIKTVCMNKDSLKPLFEEKLRDFFPGATFVAVQPAQLSAAVTVTDATESYAAAKSLANGIGLVCGDRHQTINLLPKALKHEREKGETHVLLKQVVVLAAVLAFVWIGIFAGDAVRKNRYLQELNAEVARIRNDAREAQMFEQGKQILAETREEKKWPLYIMSEVYAVVPSSVYLTLFEYSIQDGIKIRGMAKQFSDVSSLVLALQQSPAFEQVEMRFAKKRVEQNEEFTDFQINGMLAESLYEGAE